MADEDHLMTITETFIISAELEPFHAFTVQDRRP